MDWIDNADSYKCPVCGYECDNPNKHNGQCPKCGFAQEKETLQEAIEAWNRRAGDAPTIEPEIIACGDCKHWICHDRWCGYWNHGVKPLMWCSQAERREDGKA